MRAREGDRESRSQLFALMNDDGFRAWVGQKLGRALCDVDVDQIADETFFAMQASHFRIEARNGLPSFRAYARTAALNIIRKMKFERSVERAAGRTEPLDDGSTASAHDDPANLAADREEVTNLRCWIDDDGWRLLIMRVEGRTFEEIAAHLGLKPDTVRKQYRRLIGLLREWLDVDDEDG